MLLSVTEPISLGNNPTNISRIFIIPFHIERNCHCTMGINIERPLLSRYDFAGLRNYQFHPDNPLSRFFRDIGNCRTDNRLIIHPDKTRHICFHHK